MCSLKALANVFLSDKKSTLHNTHMYFVCNMYSFLDGDEAYNGAVEAATTLSGALVVFIYGFISVDWQRWGNLAIVVMTGFTSVLLYIMGITYNIWVAYVGTYSTKALSSQHVFYFPEVAI